MSVKIATPRADSGVTLIELLISVTLVSMLIVGMLFAIRVGLTALDRSNSRLLMSRRVVSVERILQREIADAIPVGAPCGAPNGPKFSFFSGDAQSLHIVSSYSLQEASRGYPRILEFQVIPGANGEGVRLIVNERYFNGPASAGALCTGVSADPLGGGPAPHFARVSIGPASFVLADKLAYCRFLYRESLPPPVLEKWWPAWSRPLLPSAVRIEMAPLRVDPAGLPLLTVTVPIHVNRDPLEQYAD
ncbi:MAG: prepilin-type N-terminal cleavage/methylation domain-containing protein [Bryobacteraceae bacterium]